MTTKRKRRSRTVRFCIYAALWLGFVGLQATSSQVTTWDVLKMLLVGAFFLGWLWSYRRCVKCGQRFFRFSSAGDDVCLDCAPPQLSKRAARRFCLGLLVILLMGSAAFAYLFWLLGLPLGVAIALGTPAMMVLLLALWLSNARSRASILTLIRPFVRELQAVDFRAAAQASHGGSRRYPLDGLTVWTDSDDVEPWVRGATTACLAQFAELTGLAADLPRVRVLCFQTAESFDVYSAAFLCHSLPVPGHFSGLVTKRVTVCLERARRLPNTADSIFAHELCHVLVRTGVRRAPPQWLDEGLSTLVARRVGEDLTEPNATLRHLRAAAARDELWSWAELTDSTSHSLLETLKDWRDPVVAGRVGLLYLEAALFLDSLCSDSPEAFTQFLRELRRSRNAADAIRQAFDGSVEERYAQWQSRVLATEVAPHRAPGNALKPRIEEELAQPILDAETPEDICRLRIRQMAALGFPWRADVLIQVLDRPNSPLHNEARRALENLAGEIHGHTAEAWRPWLASLPDGVVAKR